MKIFTKSRYFSLISIT